MAMQNGNYSAAQVDEKGVSVVRLTDAATATQVSVLPSLGNRAYEFSVRGANVLHFPFDTPGAAKSERKLNGIPFLAPWANRQPDGFRANGKHYTFNSTLEGVRLDANGNSIHGMLWASPHWQVADVGADDKSAHVTSRFEYWKHPDLMANWPFAQEYEMTYRLAAGALEVRVMVKNLSTDTMPVSIGFHPYFTLPGVPIEDVVAQIPVRKHVEVDGRTVPTGEFTPVDFSAGVSLKDHKFDDGYTDLIRGGDGRTVFSATGRGKKIEVIFGPRYPVAVVFCPPGNNYVCFEPMSGLTNAINLAADGKYPDLQTVPAGGTWQESWWLRAAGY